MLHYGLGVGAILRLHYGWRWGWDTILMLHYHNHRNNSWIFVSRIHSSTILLFVVLWCFRG